MDELRFLFNLISALESETEKNHLRRAALLIIYSHFEGFFKFAFLLYVRIINESNLKCSQVTSHILVSSFDRLFKDLMNPKSKSRVFAKPLPDDTKLHRLSRSVEFLDTLQDNLEKTVRISNEVINTESNLKPIVLRKLLYTLGLDHELFKDEEGTIHRLLGIRNSIAHGESRNGLTSVTFEEYYSTTIFLMGRIKSKILLSISQEDYLKRNAA